MPLEFARLIREYHILPDQMLNLVAVVLPWLEIVCGICFLTGLWLMGSAALLSGLNGVFIFAIAYRAWLIMSSTGVGFFDLSYDCGCGFGVVYIPIEDCRKPVAPLCRPDYSLFSLEEVLGLLHHFSSTVLTTGHPVTSCPL